MLIKDSFYPRFGVGTPVSRMAQHLRQNGGSFVGFWPISKGSCTLILVRNIEKRPGPLNLYMNSSEFPFSEFPQVKKSISWHITTEHLLCISCSVHVHSTVEESKEWIADPKNRICDAPGSWYCSLACWKHFWRVTVTICDLCLVEFFEPFALSYM